MPRTRETLKKAMMGRKFRVPGAQRRNPAQPGLFERAPNRLRLTTPALALVISACASTPPPAPSAGAVDQPPTTEEDHTDTVVAEPPDATAAKLKPTQKPCAWSEVRGIAKLLATSGQSGTWQFFPGDDILFHVVPTGAKPDDEFKALLRRPMSGPCRKPRLILFDPV